jgi:HAD superfamily hydrolase (TIGR01490 family)
MLSGMPALATVVAAFDFDGTITDSDSTTAFCRAELGGLLPAVLRAAPVLAGYPLGLVARQRLKEALLTPLLGGREETDVRARAAAWAARSLPGMVRPAAMERLRWHQSQGHRVVLVSASLDFLLEPWAREAGVGDVLATRLEVEDGRLTGRLAGSNCYGPEKVARLAALVGDLRAVELYAYGDSRGDRELLAAAQHPTYRPFRD